MKKRVTNLSFQKKLSLLICLIADDVIAKKRKDSLVSSDCDYIRFASIRDVNLRLISNHVCDLTEMPQLDRRRENISGLARGRRTFGGNATPF